MYSIQALERTVKINPFEFGFPEPIDNLMFDFDVPLPSKLACSPETVVTHPQQSPLPSKLACSPETVVTHPQQSLLQYQQFLLQPELRSYSDSSFYDEWSTSISSADSSAQSSPRLKQQSAKKYSHSQKCHVCHKIIRRDLSRHLRIHNPVARFKCFLPRDQCLHKTGQFNRPYDFKKHMLNSHFQFDDPEARKLHNLKEKLDLYGTCPCGLRTTGDGWLDHFLDGKCPVSERHLR